MRRTKSLRTVVASTGLAVAAALALAASASSASPLASSSRTRGASVSGHSTRKFLACEVTDTGGINDRSFNASAYAGLKAAAAVDKNIRYTYLGSTSTSDYTPNLNTFIGEHCGIIITVGFDMGTATAAEAKAHPRQKFAIVDFSFSPTIHNVRALLYKTNQDAFLGGYLAAAMSKSGAVGTFGGQDIPTVTIYMDGWVAGVRYYDLKNHKHVRALGWTPKLPRSATNPYNGTGLFTNDFTNQGLGKQDAQTLMSQGADVIFPVAGAVGLGAAAAVKQAGHGNLMEWVDTDGCISAPQYCSLFITSVTKGIVTSVKGAVLSAARGTFHGGNYTGTLKNGGVALSPYHHFARRIPAKVKAALRAIKAGIISGKISVNATKYPKG